jgi:hypothetical protein
MGLALTVCLGGEGRSWAQGAATAEASDGAKAQQAQQLMDEGTRQFRAGNHEEALARFEAAHALVGSPKLQFNIGQALARLGRAAAAASAFDSYLAGSTDELPAYREEAQRQLLELGDRVATVMIDCPAPSVSLTVAGAARTLGPSRRLFLDPGEVTLRVQSPSAPAAAVHLVSARPGSRHRISDCAGPAAVQPPPLSLEAAPPPRPNHRLLLLGVGATVVLGAVIAIIVVTRPEAPRSSLGNYPL